MLRSALIAMGCVLFAVVDASAGKVALSSVEGDDKGDVREAIVDALEGSELSFISEKATNRAIDNAGGDLTAMSEKQIKKLTKDLSVEAIVIASVDKDGTSKTLRFKLYVNGKKLKGFSVVYSNAKSKKFKKALQEKMVEKLASAPAADPEPAVKKDDDENGNGKKGKNGKTGKKGKNGLKKDGDDEKVAKGDDEKPKKGQKKDDDEKVARDDEKPKKGKKGDSEGEGEGEGESDGEDDEKPKKGKRDIAAADEEDEDADASITVRGTTKGRTANRVAFRVDVGGSMSVRRLAFTTRGDLAAEDRPAPFAPGPVPGARFEIEAYPLALMNPTSIASGLGIAAEFDKVISSKVAASGGVEDGTVATVNQQIYSVGARFRLPFGKSATAPSVTFGGNYGRRTFKVNNVFMDRANLDLPDTDYKYLSPYVGFRLPFTKSIAFVASGEAMLVRDAGPIQKADSYGQAKVFGIDAMGGLDIVIGNRFAVRVAGEYAQIGYTFTGGGELSKNRDGDPDTQDIGGALDRSFGGSATLGVLY